MGHVDHGKTTLLDHLRQTQIAKNELGGITQKISGFTLKNQFGEFSFIDTPGHVFFQDMRLTGASAADLVILIVSAIEGVQDQTKEVLKLLKEHKVPFLVCLNKIDIPGTNPELVEEQLIDLGVDLEPYGGTIPIVYISARTGLGVDLMLELIQETSKGLNLRAVMDEGGLV